MNHFWSWTKYSPIKRFLKTWAHETIEVEGSGNHDILQWRNSLIWMSRLGELLNYMIDKHSLKFFKYDFFKFFPKFWNRIVKIFEKKSLIWFIQKLKIHSNLKFGKCKTLQNSTFQKNNFKKQNSAWATFQKN